MPKKNLDQPYMIKTWQSDKTMTNPIIPAKYWIGFNGVAKYLLRMPLDRIDEILPTIISRPELKKVNKIIPGTRNSAIEKLDSSSIET